MTTAAKTGLDMHPENVCKTCFFWIRKVRRIRRSLDVKSVNILVHSFVTSRDDYCNSVLAFAPKEVTSCNKFRMPQRIWSEKPRNMSVVFNGCWIMVGAVQACRDCSSLSSVPRCKVPRRLLHASLQSFQPPKTPASCRKLNILQFCHTTFGTRAFSVANLMVWNSLPDSLRDPSMQSERFKQNLKSLSQRPGCIRGVTISRNRAIQIDIYLLTYYV